jgi:hypothetical protein
MPIRYQLEDPDIHKSTTVFHSIFQVDTMRPEYLAWQNLSFRDKKTLTDLLERVLAFIESKKHGEILLELTLQLRNG